VKPIKVLALTKYGCQGASSRLRTFQYLPSLARAKVEVSVQSLLSDELLQARYRRGRYGISLLSAYGQRFRELMGRRQFDLLWIEKEALPWWPLWLERSLLSGVPYVLDYDDALFHNYDLHRSALVREVFGQRLDGLMRKASLVVGGNQYLAQRALDAGAPWVEVIPTVIDLERYTTTPTRTLDSQALTLVWIGSPSTVRYLRELSKPLANLARSVEFTLRVIGAQLELPDVRVECVPWTEATEVAAIAECDIGLMPLLDTPWERGKCGYKLIQYMACALPVVASPVGANREIVREGVSGFLAESPQQWVDALGTLLTDAQLRSAMGREGRKRVEASYCVQNTGPRMAELLLSASGIGTACLNSLPC